MDGERYELEFFRKGFFGYGEPGDFKAWTAAHFAPLLAAAGGIWLIAANADRLRSSAHEELIRCALMTLIMLFEFSFFWRLSYVGPEDHAYKTMMMRLPLQVCEWTAILAIPMLFLRSRILFSLVFYLTMTCGLFPLFVPAVISTTGPRYSRYYQYWGEHILPIWAVYYLFFVHGLRPSPVGILLEFAMLFLMLAPALRLNRRFDDCYYLYLKPERFPMLRGLVRDSTKAMVRLYLSVMIVLCFIVQCVYQLLIR